MCMAIAHYLVKISNNWLYLNLNFMLMGEKRRLIVPYLLFSARTCQILIWNCWQSQHRWCPVVGCSSSPPLFGRRSSFLFLLYFGLWKFFCCSLSVHNLNLYLDSISSLLVSSLYVSITSPLNLLVFSERELMFTFARPICRRPSVCRLSSVVCL